MGPGDPLEMAIGLLAGAGPVTAARLAARDIRTARDLLLGLPRGYDDLRRPTSIARLAEVGDGAVVLVQGTVKRVHVFPRRLLDVFVEGDGATVRARWFRAPGAMAKAFPKGSVIALVGPLRTAGDGTRELVHPTQVTAALAARGDGGLGLRPRYPIVDGVKARLLDRLRASALAALAAGGPAVELLPATARARLGLPSLAEALVRLHTPADGDAVAPEALGRARRRIALETSLVTQLAFLLRRASTAGGGRSVPVATSQAARIRLESALAFSPTASQARALDEIAADLARPQAMRRLLIGDVASGKTVVAFGAAAMFAAGGSQTLMMVPTEVLAEQQARVLAPWAARCGFEIGLLTGSTPARARETILEASRGGRVQLLIGTQALLGPEIALPRLGLVVVDEQHRFGVADRARLGRGAGAVPHLLTMTATPIPRSLALALHGDLDASFLSERPGGRRPPATVVCVGADERRAATARLDDAVAAGEQAFVVCPVRQEARRPGAVTAIAAHARLVRALAPARVGLLHGALGASDKEHTLRAFGDGKLDVLVATTVVELGIDVANATVMIVEDADRFGLAQLHQLRGRVGRGTRPGICFLCASTGADAGGDGMARLRLCAEIDDGFRLAEADLARRGWGTLDGTEQAGLCDGPLAGDAEAIAARLREIAELTATARREAETVLAVDPTLEAPAHRRLALAARDRVAKFFAGEAG
ncbi:MAG TPA: ATP-dependent DNA helicase RecG [Polyangia bacterium]|nr:ATP-dependent DNA helicase RecG [Polyangia bacterium]